MPWLLPTGQPPANVESNHLINEGASETFGKIKAQFCLCFYLFLVTFILPSGLPSLATKICYMPLA